MNLNQNQSLLYQKVIKFTVYLFVVNVRLLSGVYKQDIEHYIPYLHLLEHQFPRVGPLYILHYHFPQFVVLEELCPGTLRTDKTLDTPNYNCVRSACTIKICIGSDAYLQKLDINFSEQFNLKITEYQDIMAIIMTTWVLELQNFLKNMQNNIISELILFFFLAMSVIQFVDM